MSYEQRRAELQSIENAKQKTRKEFDQFKRRKSVWEESTVNQQLISEGYGYRSHVLAELERVKGKGSKNLENRLLTDLSWCVELDKQTPGTPPPAKQSATITPAIQSGTTTTKEDRTMSINYNRRDNQNRLKAESLTAEENTLYRFMMGEGIKSEDALHKLAMAEDQQEQFEETQRFNQQ